MDIPPRPQPLLILLLVCILGFGVWLRLPTSSGCPETGFDEHFYSRYVKEINSVGLVNYPVICEYYLERQTKANTAFLPPTRVAFLTSASFLSRVFHLDPLKAVRVLSSLFSCLLLLAAALCAWRMGGLARSLAVSVLVACSPLDVHIAHRAWADGFFAFWALLTLWSLWENLRQPNHRAWLAVLVLSLFMMILSKENAFFVFVALCVLVVAARRLGFGTARPALVAAVILGALLGGLVLMACTGGPGTLIAVLKLNVEKSRHLPYAIATGGGPWQRYLVDLLFLNPLLTLLAVGGLLNAGADRANPNNNRAGLFLGLFTAVTYLVKSQVKGGMNLRYGNIWTLPLAWLAAGQLAAWLAAVRRESWRPVLLGAAVCVVAASELRLYHTVFVRSKIYDPVTFELGFAQGMFHQTPAPADPDGKNGDQ